MVVALFAGLTRPAYGAEAAADAKEETKLTKTFPPEVEAKFAEFLKKITEAERKLLAQQMQKETEEMAKATGLGAEPTKALAAAAQQAVDQSMEGWSAKLDKEWRQEGGPSTEQMSTMLDQMLTQADNLVKQEGFGGERPAPADKPAWTEAVRRTLSPEQAAAWANVKKGRSDAMEKEVGAFLDAQVEKTREQYRQAILAKCDGISRTLGLSKERADQLDALAKSAADKGAEDSRQQRKKSFLQMPAEQRKRMIKGGGFYMWSEEKNQPENQAIWKDGLAKLLSEDEQKLLKTAQEDRKRKRIHVMGEVMLALLDEKIAFTARQRQLLQPIAEQLAKNEPSLFPSSGGESSSSFSPSTFYTAAKKASEEEIKAILDPAQCKRWKEIDAANDEDDSDSMYSSRLSAKAKPAEGTKPPPIAEPEDVERNISDFLILRAERERKRLLAVMTLKAEDAARIGALAPNAVSRLQTAARGAAESSLAQWKSNIDQTVRSQVQDATPQNIKMRLESIEGSYYLRENASPPDQETLWGKTVKAELNEPQQTAWNQEIEERSRCHDKSIASFIMAEFERRNPLSAEQWNKLEPLISGILKEYSQDIAMEFSSYSGSQSPWYMQSYSMFLPFAGVPENDLKAILGKEQCERWLGSSEFSNNSNYWDSIQTYHKQRLQEAKAKK